jgi:hypothetical protein
MIVPAAIDFHSQHDWPAARQRCHDLAARARADARALVEAMGDLLPAMGRE